MRLRTALVAIVCGVVPLPLPTLAHATDCSGILSPCINDDALWPHAGPAQFVSIGSTETVGAGRLGFGLVSTYLSRPVVLHVASPGAGGSDQYAVDNQVNGTFLWAYGVTDRLELDLAVPITYYQDGTGLSPVTGGDVLNDTATRDLRFGLAYALVRRPQPAPLVPGDSRPPGAVAPTRNGFGLAARFEMSAPSGDRSQFAADAYGVFVPSLAADFRVDRTFVGVEVGARIRPSTHLLGASLGSQLVTAVGVGYDILPRSLLSAVLEAWALPVFDEQSDEQIDPATGAITTVLNGKHITPAEWQLSARTAPLRGGDLSIQLGGGSALPLSGDVVTQPRFRFTLGIRWAPSGHAGAPTPRPAPPPDSDGPPQTTPAPPPPTVAP
jgi:hypothetical protein